MGAGAQAMFPTADEPADASPLARKPAGATDSTTLAAACLMLLAGVAAAQLDLGLPGAAVPIGVGSPDATTPGLPAGDDDRNGLCVRNDRRGFDVSGMLRAGIGDSKE